MKVVTSVFQWLGSVVNMCNKKLGTPFERCEKVFEGAVTDCRAKLGPMFEKVCNLTYLVKTLCYAVKPLDFICMLVSFVTDVVVGAVRKSTRTKCDFLAICQLEDRATRWNISFRSRRRFKLRGRRIGFFLRRKNFSQTRAKPPFSLDGVEV